MWIGGGPSGAIGSLSGRLARQVGILKRFSGRPFRHASFTMYSLIDNGLKSAIFFKVGVLLIAGRHKYHVALKKSCSKICTFQPVIIDPDRPPNLSLCFCYQ